MGLILGEHFTYKKKRKIFAKSVYEFLYTITGIFLNKLMKIFKYISLQKFRLFGELTGINYENNKNEDIRSNTHVTTETW